MNDCVMNNGNGNIKINGDSPNGESSSSPPAPPAPPKTPRERVEQARDLAIDLFNECGGMVHYAGVVTDHYLKLIHSYEITEELDLGRGWLVFDIAWSLSEKMKRLRQQLERADTLIEPFADLYDGVSAGPLTIGHITGSSAHATAVLLGRYFLAFFQKKGPRLMPLEGEGRREPNDLSLEQLLELLPKWRVSAQRAYHEILNVVGLDYEKDYEKWVALTRVEAGKVLAALPPAPPMTEEEKMVVRAVLDTGNKPLIQWKLLDAAGLKQTGTNNAMLSSMRQRGLLDNKGKGYFVPPSMVEILAAVVAP